MNIIKSLKSGWNRLTAALFVFTMLLFMSTPANAAVDEAITGLVTDATTVFGSVKTLAITILTVAIGIRLVRKFAK